MRSVWVVTQIEKMFVVSVGKGGGNVYTEKVSSVIVLTCSAYDEADYIREYKEFLAAH